MTEPLEPWRAAFRAAEPLLSTGGLEALRRALASDDPRLLQGQTTQPPPLLCVQDWPVEGACALTYCGVAEMGGFGPDTHEALLARVPEEPPATAVLPYDETPRPDAPGACTIAQAEEFFARTCHEIDRRLGEPAGCRWFLNAYDEWPREEMRRELLPEVERALAARGKVEAV